MSQQFRVGQMVYWQRFEGGKTVALHGIIKEVYSGSQLLVTDSTTPATRFVSKAEALRSPDRPSKLTQEAV